MLRRPPRSGRTYILCAYPPLFRSFQDLSTCGFHRKAAAQTVVLTRAPEPEPLASSVIKWPVTSSHAPLVSAIWPCIAMTVQVLARSAEHPSELQSLMRISYAVFCLKTNKSITRKNIRLELTH